MSLSLSGNGVVTGLDSLASSDLSAQLGSKVDYPSGGSDGNVLTKSGTAAAWSAPEAAGLTLITAESFSAVSSVSINGCFSATYDNYTMLMRATHSATSIEVELRMRASGTDETGANYSYRFALGAGTFSTNVVGGGFTGQTSGRISVVDTVDNNVIFANIFDPFLAKRTLWISKGNEDANNIREYNIDHTLANSYDGFTLLVASGTITGNLRIYGYRN